jgi:hypothetical protein
MNRMIAWSLSGPPVAKVYSQARFIAVLAPLVICFSPFMVIAGNVVG